MADHVHGCLTCRPAMVPDFDPADPRYHDSEVCGTTLRATVDGAEPGYHKGVFTGPDGWVLLACEGFNTEQIHACPTCTTDHGQGGCYRTCLEPRFGLVEVIHDCPRDLAERAERLAAALKPLVSEETYLRARFGQAYDR